MYRSTPTRYTPGQPSSHQQLWSSLQRRFAAQCKPGAPAEGAVRAIQIQPLPGQEQAAVWSLGFLEQGSTRRTASLSRDFQSVAATVEPDQKCYIVVYVGDLNKTRSSLGQPKPAQQGEWVLIAYVPETCTAADAKQMADNRAGLKAGLGAEFFCGDMWCLNRQQIALSNYLKTMDAGPSAAVPMTSTQQEVVRIQAALRGNATRKGVAREKSRKSNAAQLIQGIQRRRSAASLSTDGVGRVLGGVAEAPSMDDAVDEVWEERLQGARSAYMDSCKRLNTALEELEQTLCMLNGDEYKHAEPILHSRAHLVKKLEIMQATGQGA